MMEPKDNFENINLPYVRNVNPTLVWDEIGTISGEERSRKMIYILRKTHDDFQRYSIGWNNKKIHGTTNTAVHNG